MVRYDIFERLMKERGVKAVDVAKATKIPQSTFTDWKMGRVKSMKAEVMLAVAEYLHVSVNYLMTGEESKYYNFDYVIKDPRFHELIEKYTGHNSDRTAKYYEKISSLNDTDKQIIKDMVERLSDGYKEEHNDQR